jgi:hypothetical protein
MTLRPPRRGPGRLPALLTGTLLLFSAPSVRAETLYTLESFCSLDGTEAVPCRIEALNDRALTEYRHRIGAREVRFRVADEPHTRVELWDGASQRWRTARNATAYFALNALCLDGTSFCAINPNDLNSVRQSLGRAANGRSVMAVRFGQDGRINASCYDAGCPGGDQPAP